MSLLGVPRALDPNRKPDPHVVSYLQPRRTPAPAGDIVGALQRLSEAFAQEARALRSSAVAAPPPAPVSAPESSAPAPTVAAPPSPNLAPAGLSRFAVVRDELGDIRRLTAPSGVTYMVTRNEVGDIAHIDTNDGARYTVERDGVGDIQSIVAGRVPA